MKIGRLSITFQRPMLFHVAPRNWACENFGCRRFGKLMALGQGTGGCCPNCGSSLKRVAGP